MNLWLWFHLMQLFPNINANLGNTVYVSMHQIDSYGTMSNEKFTCSYSSGFIELTLSPCIEWKIYLNNENVVIDEKIRELT